MAKIKLKETIKIKEMIFIERNSTYDSLCCEDCRASVKNKVDKAVNTRYVSKHRLIKNSIKYKMLKKYHQEWTGWENI